MIEFVLNFLIGPIGDPTTIAAQFGGIPPAIAAIIAFALDRIESARRNRGVTQNLETLEEGVGAGQADLEALGRRQPSFFLDNQLLGGPLQGQFNPATVPFRSPAGVLESANEFAAGRGFGPAIDLSSILGGPGAQLDFFRQNLPDLNLEGLDLNLGAGGVQDILGGTLGAVSGALGGARGSIADILGGIPGQVQENLQGALESAGQTFEAGRGSIQDILGRARTTQAGLLQGVDLPETDLTPVLGARLAGIGASSQARQQLQQEALASQAGRFGGLQNLQGQLRGLSFGEGAQRGLLAGQAAGQTRQEELAAQEFVTGVQSQASSLSAQLNAALSQAGAGIERDLTLGQAGQQFQGGLAGSEAALAAALAQASSEQGFGAIEAQTAGQAQFAGATAEENAINRLFQQGVFNSQIQERNLGRRLGAFQDELGLVGRVGDADTQRLLTGLGLGSASSAFEAGLTQQQIQALLSQFGLLGGAGQLTSESIPFGLLLAQQSALNPPQVDTGGSSSSFDFDIGQVVAAIIAAKASSGQCIDGSAQIRMADGSKKTLSLVKKGDKVKGGTTGVDCTVLDLDYGAPHPERKFDYVRVSTGKKSLILTKDHPINNVPAGQIHVGDVLYTEDGNETVTDVQSIDSVPSGDLFLDNDGAYIANGMRIMSLMEREDTQKQEEADSCQDQ